MAGHAGDGVVQNDHGGVGLVIGNIGKAGHAGVHEGGVTDNGNGSALTLLAQSLVKAVGGGDGRAHAQCHVHGGQRSHRAQRVAADIAQHGALVLAQGVEQAAVGAAGAHDRGAGRNDVLQSLAGMYFTAQTLGHQILRELAQNGQHVLAGHLQTHGPAGVFHDGVQFLNNHKLLDLGGKVADELLGQGMDHAQLEHGYAVPEHFLYILVGGGGGDDAHVSAAHLHPVQGGGLSVLGKFCHTLLHEGVAADGVAGHHDVLGDVLLIGLGGDFLTGSGLHHGLGVGHAGAHLQQHRTVKLLGDLISGLGEGQSLGRVGGLQHGQLGSHGIVPGVLLVLGGVHAGVVGHGDDHARIHTGVCHGEQGVGGHVQAHVLHGAEGALARQTCAEGGLHGYLFIGSPLGVDLIKFGHLLGDLGAGGAGVAGHHAAAGLVQATGNGGVAQH